MTKTPSQRLTDIDDQRSSVYSAGLVILQMLTLETEPRQILKWTQSEGELNKALESTYIKNGDYDEYLIILLKHMLTFSEEKRPCYRKLFRELQDFYASRE